MTIKVVLSKGAERDIRRIADRVQLQRIIRAIEQLSDDPRSSGAKKLGGVSGIWRIRVGDWRVCYMLEQPDSVLLVLTVARRGNVYERLRRRLG
ncbi:MAG: type II toxin-antitoxin system RelE/ParE family toxin [Holophagales bacterium]|nr:type II toxin-antitoxin system RelE/ParE family toxin [Holophagales bacterium]MYG29495.1 type II toxin-antitoxin system RelE/ParE family toxin [Holophagales bacterium]MYI79987.1 type II toxin-antitoxin system RelE/ParE family toxin [Holophagales bacterium]